MSNFTIDDVGSFNSEPDNEFAALLKRLKGRGDLDDSIAFKYRFLNKHNLKNLIDKKVTQSVVIKIIGRGRGTSHLNFLMRYVSRDLESQANEQKAELIDQDGNILDVGEFQEVIEDWAKDFDKKESGFSEDELKVIDEQERIKAALNDKLYSSGLSDGEAKLLHYSKRFHDMNKVSKELEVGSLAQNKENGEVGFVVRPPKNYKVHFITLDKEGQMKGDILDINNVENSGHKIKTHTSHLEKDFSHILLSTGGDKPDKKLALQATQNYLRDNFKSKGFEYMVAMHDDTKNLHFHVVLKNKSQHESVPKFNPNKFDLQALRINYARELDGYGVNREATLKFDKASYVEKLKLRAERIQKVDKNWWEYKLQESDNKNFDALKFRKNAIQQIVVISDMLDKQGEFKAAAVLRAQKDTFKKLEPKEIHKVIEMTAEKLEKEKEQLGDTFKERFLSSLGNPAKYKREKRDMDKIADSYLNHVQEARKALETIDKGLLTPELVKRQRTAIRTLEQIQNETLKDKGIEMELER